MEKVQVSTEIDVKDFLAQLKTNELEELLREAAATLTRRKTGDKKAREAALLQQLNEQCVLPEAHLKTFLTLVQKRNSEQLTAKEAEKLSKLIKEEERLRLKRIEILGELAQLKGISLRQLADQLGINTPENA